MQISTDKVLKCTQSKCGEELKILDKVHEKKVAPLVKKLNTIASQVKSNKISAQEANGKAKPLFLKIQAELLKIVNSKETDKFNSCVIKNCTKEHKNNFKVLNSYFTKNCETSQKEKDCKLKDLSSTLASKTHKLSTDDIKEFTILERELKATPAVKKATKKATPAVKKATKKATPATAKAAAKSKSA